jgi:chromosome condensin MukBEF ATPase and DNA-binding subunit MukB
MQTKEEIERQIAFLEKELKDLQRDLNCYDIKEGDLVLVVAKKEWSNYVHVVRVDSVSSMAMGGRSLDSSGYTCPASYCFDKNVFIKITI